MRMTKLFLATILPWLGFLGLLAYEGHKVYVKSLSLEALRSTLHPDMAGALVKAEILRLRGDFTVVSYENAATETEGIIVTPYNRHLVTIERDIRTPGSLRVSVYRGDGNEHVELMSCGGLRDDGEFPRYVGVYPQTGADAGWFYGDYDLDGKFELKRLGLRGSTMPAREPASRPVDPRD